ncbi:hypothetical protein AXF42_Ash010655 [Apostasia shenzhenica]|uniref:Uncharacterized protein n=1 Tax=Apostasia shenzhenica TaxID=1088818 RepID=A0A2I0A6R0_9ASPA|nr:hypothetical protein AXF42_Ash010655 [Apostasia shenzhenica]
MSGCGLVADEGDEELVGARSCRRALHGEVHRSNIYNPDGSGERGRQLVLHAFGPFGHSWTHGWVHRFRVRSD